MALQFFKKRKIFINLSLIFVSPQNPIHLQTRGEQIWVSQSDIVEIQSLEAAVVLRGKNPGRIFISGIKKVAEPGTLTTVVSLSTNDYQAMSQCGHEFYDFSTTPPTWTGTSQQLKTLSNKFCLFGKLKFSQSFDKTEFEPDFVKFESYLQEKGFRFTEVPRWEKSRRSIKLVFPNQNRIGTSTLEDFLSSSENLMPFGYLLPFYEAQAMTAPQPGRTLIFDLILFEVSRSRATALGISLPFFSEGAVFDFSSLMSGNPDFSGFQSLHFDFGESQGWGRVLARPQLRTKPGQVAEFLSGGELGITKKDMFSNSLEWKQYGLSLKLKPSDQVHTGSPEITVDLETELSEPDAATSSDGSGAFGFRSRKLKSQFDLRVDSRTFLGALVLSRSGTQTQGPALLSGIPILGKFFSKSYSQTSDSELWIGLEARWSEILP